MKKQKPEREVSGSSKLLTPIPLDILEGIRKGDQVAFAKYYAGVQRSLVSFITRLIGDPEEALNIAHDTLIKLWEEREQIDKITGFVYTVATRDSLDLLRKRKVEEKYINEQMLDLNAEAPAADEQVMYKDLLAVFERVIENMPPQRRKIFRMNRDEDLTYNEIAERLGISYNAVMKQMKLALKDLRRLPESMALSFFFGLAIDFL